MAAGSSGILDATDRRILRVLQVDGRITNQDLAKQCNVSPSACLDRLKRLRRDGYVTGFAAQLDPRKLERSLLIFIEVMLDRTTGDIFEEFATAVRELPDILECHMVAGGFDYLLKARMRDVAAYRKFLGETLVSMPGVRETRTYTVLEEVKNSAVLPV